MYTGHWHYYGGRQGCQAYKNWMQRRADETMHHIYSYSHTGEIDGVFMELIIATCWHACISLWLPSDKLPKLNLMVQKVVGLDGWVEADLVHTTSIKRSYLIRLMWPHLRRESTITTVSEDQLCSIIGCFMWSRNTRMRCSTATNEHLNSIYYVLDRL